MSMLDRLETALESMIESLDEKASRPLPDWVNTHDFRSGQAVESRRSFSDRAADARYVLWWVRRCQEIDMSKN